jgi:hypothetical protein
MAANIDTKACDDLRTPDSVDVIREFVPKEILDIDARLAR